MMKKNYNFLFDCWITFKVVMKFYLNYQNFRYKIFLSKNLDFDSFIIFFIIFKFYCLGFYDCFLVIFLFLFLFFN